MQEELTSSVYDMEVPKDEELYIYIYICMYIYIHNKYIHIACRHARGAHVFCVRHGSAERWQNGRSGGHSRTVGRLFVCLEAAWRAFRHDGVPREW